MLLRVTFIAIVHLDTKIVDWAFLDCRSEKNRESVERAKPMIVDKISMVAERRFQGIPGAPEREYVEGRTVDARTALLSPGVAMMITPTSSPTRTGILRWEWRAS